ncbi:hypothetical protein J3A83DRAFT_4539040 [Scleroderma citrinum]
MLNALDPVDQWNDSQATLRVSHPVERVEEHLQGIAIDEEELTVTGLKVAKDSPTDDGAPLEDIADPPFMQANQASSVATSVHSLPVRHASATHLARPSTAPSPLFPEHASHPFEAVTQVSVTASGRQLRHCSSNERSRSTNRLSGFFSSLIHRRETTSQATPRPLREQRSATPVQRHSTSISRPSSPPIPARPTTPPPTLPPPTLRELGLSLSAITATLSPSHFSTPPTSGAFLAPHYLLLCHAQGLDVLPLVSPPALQPYTLVRKVPFKYVVVMEHRGVLVAIAGRRNGVRVYALEEVKKAIEWRIEEEVRRERERKRREEVKKTGASSTRLERRQSTEKRGRLSPSTFLTATPDMQQKDDKTLKPSPAFNPVMPKRPKPPTSQPLSLRPVGQPPSYTHATDGRPSFGNQRSAVPVNVPRSRRASHSLVVVPAVPPPVPKLGGVQPSHAEAKFSDWQGGSDDEAIDMLTAGASGSQALDERTSSIPPRNDDQHNDVGGASAALPIRTHTIPSNRRPSLQGSPSSVRPSPVGDPGNRGVHPDADADEEDEDDVASVPGEPITLAQALLESRLPHLPPAGTLQPQEPILIASSTTTGFSSDNESSTVHDVLSSQSRSFPNRVDRRRRWSTLGGIFSVGVAGLDGPSSPLVPTPSPNIPEEESISLTRSLSQSRPSTALTSLPPRPSTSGGGRPSISDLIPPVPTSTLPRSSHTRILPRFFSSAFGSRRNGERDPPLTLKKLDADSKRSNTQTPGTPHAPPPKLEYVKLPGTKGTLMIKAVETQKKSFLAILCGENGEKVELFAGTYRTALGLSRTFILPDSPKSLELQLQGDDLVEVFLMFSQNVFGLEPATVRVREVRIGRAERRAARRRVREIRSGQNDVFDTDPLAVEDEETAINIGISVTINQEMSIQSNSNVQPHEPSHTPSGNAHEAALAYAEELVALASVQVGPYTTFQQLSFAPKFPLATVADDYIIPPTYADFLGYRAEHEPDTCGNGNPDLATIQFNPPGLPMPAPAPPSRWCYRDPRGNVHGPWKATLMQAWYKDGLLPPDLPVRKESDGEFILLRDLRQQCVDPVHPFRSAPPPQSTIHSGPPLSVVSKPLLPPISLLIQPRHFGPPSLFYSSRGGHSTSIVDARGRAVMKGRFIWSPDEGDEPFPQRMGDVKRLEAFDIQDRSVIVAMRQGGLEAMDFRDALLKPADESRNALPSFCPPPSNISRRMPFVWKMGMPIAPGTPGITPLSTKTKTIHLAKKASIPVGKSPARSEFTGSGEGDSDIIDEVLFLGRNGDDLYLCERNAGTFRILRLCPEMPS